MENMQKKYSLSEYIVFTGWGFGFLTFIMVLGERFNLLMLLFFILGYVFIFLLGPVVAIVNKNKGEYISFADSFLIGLRGLFTISGIAAFYKIFISLDYDIYISYWILPISFLFLMSMEKIENKIKLLFNIDMDELDDLEDDDDKEYEKKSLWGKVKNPLSILVSALLLYHQYYEPVLIITREDLLVPTTIHVSLIEKQRNEYGDILNFRRPAILFETENPDIIKKLWSDIPKDGINKLRYGELINHQKVKRIYDKHYSIYLFYDDDLRRLATGENRADYIEVYPNGNAYILKYNRSNYKFEVFPIELSQSTLKELGISPL